MLIRFKKQSDVRPSEITPESVYHDRRRFMKTAALAGAGLALGAWPLPSFAARPSLPGPVHPSKWSKENLPKDDTLNSWKDITSYNNFYEFGVYKSDPKDNAGDFTVDPWSIEVSGACNKPGKLSYDELMKPTKLEDRVYRHRCVEAWSMVIPWIGVPLASVLKRFEPTGDAKFVAFETIMDPKEMPGQQRQILNWPYKEGLRMDEAMNDLAILAVGLYGKPMPNQNGAPIRLVVPWKYGFKSIKSIVRINFQKEMPPTSWNEASPREYGFYSNVNPHVPHPRWSQAKERRIGEFFKRPTMMFNGYQEEVASLYAGMDLRKNF